MAISEFEAKNIRFRLATLEHGSDMFQFHNSYYGTARTAKDWLWEYNTYNSGKAVFTFALDADKIIATQGMLPIYIAIGERVLLSGKSENTLMLPVYRGTQIMEKLYEYAVEKCIVNGMKFLWGFTPAVKAFKRFGFESYQGTREMVKLGNLWSGIKLKLKTKSPLSRRIASTGRFILKHYSAGKNVNINQFHYQTAYELRRGITDESLLKALFNRLRLQNKTAIFINYDQEYLKWRVRENPSIKYVEYQVYSFKDLKAYAIVALVRNILSISDLTSEDDNATSFLLHTILKDYGTKAAEFHCLLNTQDILNQGVLKQLYNFGFSAGGSWNFVVRDLKKGNNKEIFDIRNWHINGLWTEGYSM